MKVNNRMEYFLVQSQQYLFRKPVVICHLHIIYNYHLNPSSTVISCILSLPCYPQALFSTSCFLALDYYSILWITLFSCMSHHIIIYLLLCLLSSITSFPLWHHLLGKQWVLNKCLHERINEWESVILCMLQTILGTVNIISILIIKSYGLSNDFSPAFLYARQS